MIAVLLLGLSAWAQPVDPIAPPEDATATVEGADVAVAPADAVAERLLGEVPVDDAEMAPPPAPLGNGWPIGLLVVAGALLWYGRSRLQRRASAESGSELRIVGRTALGAAAGLAVVEVRGRDGNWRRLVVGTGDGAPSLVADLGEPAFGFLGLAEDEPLSVDDGFAPLGAPEDLRAAIEHTKVDPPELDAHAKMLIDEVLGERGARRRSSFKTLA